jgi:hypothetical protein
MLDRWAEKLTERNAISDFWEWLESDCDVTDISAVNIEKALDEYHEIDRAALDRERRELLSTNVTHDRTATR